METIELKTTLKKWGSTEGIAQFVDEVNKLSYFKHEGEDNFITLPNLINGFEQVRVENGIVSCYLKQETGEQKPVIAAYIIERREWIKDDKTFLFYDIHYDRKFIALKNLFHWKVWETKTGNKVTHTWTVTTDVFSDVAIESHRVTVRVKPALRYMLE